MFYLALGGELLSSKAETKKLHFFSVSFVNRNKCHSFHTAIEYFICMAHK